MVITAKDFVDALLMEAPINVYDTDFGLTDDRKNSDLLRDLTSHGKSKKIDSFNGTDLLKTGNKIFASDGNRILYVVQWEDNYNRTLRLNSITQIAVWRNTTVPATQGMSKHVFWNILFPIHNAITTDNGQTSAGRNFWSIRIGEALDSGVGVYYLDMNSKTVSKISSGNDLISSSKIAYGDAHKFRARKFCITSHELISSDPR